ncbi:hypothetical protein DICVIV_06077 [Dictyocaulus viviparus]|uniref:Uncharacterized protein n=1 Tax=Dictyocaulus viviparus TaxID=29172 RepID=A0A0D8XZS5_DICVI|nr:hypothetical protein DICVIV_06077 [Dictyocaulus viviparus]
MPRLRVTRPNAIIRSQTEFLVDLFSNIERGRRTSSSSEEYYPDYTERSLSSSSDTSASNTESEEEELHQELSTGYHTVSNRIRTRSSRASTHPNGVNFREVSKLIFITYTISYSQINTQLLSPH